MCMMMGETEDTMSQIRRPSTRFAYILRNKVETSEVRCCYCGRRLAVKDVTLDHVVPQVRGGSNEPSNVVVCCGTCNRAKSDTLVTTFVRELAAVQAAAVAAHVAPSGSSDLDVEAIASEIEAELVVEISARVRRERRRSLNRKAGRWHAHLASLVGRKAA